MPTASRMDIGRTNVLQAGEDPDQGRGQVVQGWYQSWKPAPRAQGRTSLALLQWKTMKMNLVLSQRQRQLKPKRKRAVCAVPNPQAPCQIREFLSATGFCWIWIPGFSVMAKPLYEATKGGEWELLIWGKRRREGLPDHKTDSH